MNRPARKHEEGHGNDERWLVTYADMITLLMAFFIMMYAMSIVNLGKFNELAVSVRSGFGGDAPGQRSSAVGFESSNGHLPMQLPANAFGVMRQVAEAVQGSLSSSERESVQFLAEDGVVKMRIKADDVLFARGSAALTHTARHTLGAIASAIRPLPYDVRVEGHTCDLPIQTGQFASNWELSAQRATNVVVFFIQNGEMAPKRLSAVGYADTAPVAPNTSEENRARNRRIDVVLTRPLNAAQGQKTREAQASPPEPDITPDPVVLVPGADEPPADDAAAEVTPE